MKKLSIGLLLLLYVASPSMAQEDALTRESFIPDLPAPQESQNYTYVINEDGSAQVWLRVDGLSTKAGEQSYKLTLPNEFKGTAVSAWIRENGCLQYKNDTCVYYGSTNWKEVVSTLDGRNLSLTLPAPKYIGRYNENNLSLGMTFEVDGATTKHWWGRTVSIATGTVASPVSYLNIGVYLPEGVYTRDKSQGPMGWSASLAETMNAVQMRPSADMSIGKMATSSMFDMAGSGQIYRSRNNLMPGQSYQFSFMSSTAVWKLYYPEIGFGILWVLSIGLVIALLLRLIIGKRPFTWYLAVVGLLVMLSILIGGLWFAYHTAFGRPGYGGGPIMPFYKEAVVDSAPVMEPMIQETVQVEAMPVEATTLDTDSPAL